MTRHLNQAPPPAPPLTLAEAVNAADRPGPHWLGRIAQVYTHQVAAREISAADAMTALEAYWHEAVEPAARTAYVERPDPIAAAFERLAAGELTAAEAEAIAKNPPTTLPDDREPNQPGAISVAVRWNPRRLWLMLRQALLHTEWQRRNDPTATENAARHDMATWWAEAMDAMERVEAQADGNADA